MSHWLSDRRATSPIPWGTSFRTLPRAQLKLPQHAILRRVAGSPALAASAHLARRTRVSILHKCVGVLHAHDTPSRHPIHVTIVHLVGRRMDHPGCPLVKTEAP